MDTGKVDFAMLSTYHRTMLLARHKDFPNTLFCSRVFSHDEEGQYTTPRLLATMLLGAVWDKRGLKPKENRVAFGTPPRSTDNEEPSDLCPRGWKQCGLHVLEASSI